MSKVLYVNQNEYEKIMNSRNGYLDTDKATPFTFVIDLSHKTSSVDINDPKCVLTDIPYEFAVPFMEKYPNVYDITPMSIVIGVNPINRYFNAKRDEINGQGASPIRKSDIVKSIVSEINKSIDSGLELARLMFKAFEDDRDIIFVCDSQTPDDFFNVQKEVISQIFQRNPMQIKIPVFTYDEFMINPDMCEISKLEEKCKSILKYIITYRRSRGMVNEVYIFNTADLDYVKQDFNGKRLIDMAKLCKMYGVPKDEIYMPTFKGEQNEEAKISMINSLMKIIYKHWYDRYKNLNIKDLDRSQIMLGLDRLDIKYNESMDTKVLRKRLKEELDRFEKRQDGRSREALEELTLNQLEKKAVDLGIDTGKIESLNRRKNLIHSILVAEGIINENYVLPSKEELMNMKKKEIWAIFVDNYYDPTIHGSSDYSTAKEFPKETMVKFLIEEDEKRIESKLFKSFVYEDLEDVSLTQLIEIIEKEVSIKSLRKELIKKVKSFEKLLFAIDYIVNRFNIPFRFEVEGIKFKDQDELNGMDKKDVLKYSNLELKLNLSDLLSKKDIIKIILKEQKIRIKEEEKLKRKSEFNFENLLRLSKKEVHSIAKAIGFKFSLEWSKEKVCKKLIQYHEEMNKMENNIKKLDEKRYEERLVDACKELGVDIVSAYKEFMGVQDIGNLKEEEMIMTVNTRVCMYGIIGNDWSENVINMTRAIAKCQIKDNKKETKDMSNKNKEKKKDKGYLEGMQFIEITPDMIETGDEDVDTKKIERDATTLEEALKIKESRKEAKSVKSRFNANVAFMSNRSAASDYRNAVGYLNNNNDNRKGNNHNNKNNDQRNNHYDNRNGNRNNNYNNNNRNHNNGNRNNNHNNGNNNNNRHQNNDSQNLWKDNLLKGWM